MELTKEKFIQILEEIKVSYNEGITQDDKTGVCPRVDFWDYAWEPIVASGNRYNTIVTYQISFYNYCIPRKSKELLELIIALNDYNISPIINHEYVEKDKIWHSYFSIEILEKVY